MRRSGSQFSYTTTNRVMIRPMAPRAASAARPTRRGPTAYRRPSRSRAAGPGRARRRRTPSARDRAGGSSRGCGRGSTASEAARWGRRGRRGPGAAARPRSRATPSRPASELERRAARATRSSPTAAAGPACGRTRGAEIFWGPCTTTACSPSSPGRLAVVSRTPPPHEGSSARRPVRSIQSAFRRRPRKACPPRAIEAMVPQK